MKKFIATTAFAALPLIAAAVPAYPGLMRHTNPDGSVVEFRAIGDEHFNYFTDAKGENILTIDKAGHMVPMLRDGKALRNVETDILRLRTEQDLPVMQGGRSVQRMASLETKGPDSGRTKYPTAGAVRSCVILLEYPDRPYTVADKKGTLDEEAHNEATVKLFERLLNEENFHEYGNFGSAADYYKAVSYGKFEPQFDVYGPVKLQHPAAWYAKVADDDPLWDRDENGKSRLPIEYQNYLNTRHSLRFCYAIAEAMEALDDTVDFSLYDYDENGIIDNIFFFFSGQGMADSGDSTAIWPHQGDYTNFTDPTLAIYRLFPMEPQVRDGVKLETYATSCEINSQVSPSKQPFLNGVGTFCHEFGHVLGLPDLYDSTAQHAGTSSSVKTPGNYSLMDSGSYNGLGNIASTCPPGMSAYERWLCKWLEFTEVEDNNTYTLNPLCSDEGNALRIRTRKPGGTVSYHPEYYVIESRADNLWDQSLPGHGTMIWRINYNLRNWTANTVNSSSSVNVEIIGPDEPRTMTWPDADNGIFSIYPDMNVFTPSFSVKPLNVYITNMEFDKESGVSTLEYNVYTPTDLVTVLHDNPAADHNRRYIYLQWDEVPGMQYQLTVRRRNTNGDYAVVDGLDNTIIDENRRVVRNISRTQWSQTFTARVRLFNNVPGKEYSNTLTFIPENLPEALADDPWAEVGVDEVDAAIPAIYGGKGCVVAPEGAKVYTLSGVECGTSELQPGIYIVVTPYAMAKVTVR